MSFCETKLSNDIEHLYNIQGYKLLTNNRNHYGGGVCMYIKKNMFNTVLKDVSIINDNIETLFVETKLINKPVTVGIVYRRPNGSITLFNESLESMLQNVTSTGKTCLLLGDFNINLMNFNDINVNQFITVLTSYGFYPCINKPTRVSKTSATIIDHIWVNDIDMVSKSGILLLDVSDHFSPFICYEGKIERSKNLCFTYRDYDNMDDSRLCEYMRERFSTVERDDNPDREYNMISNIISSTVEEVIPLKSVKIKSKQVNKPWISQEILEHIKERHKLYKKYLKRPIMFGNKYRECRNRVNNLIKDAERCYYRSKLSASQGNGKQTWKIINEIINSKEEQSKLEYLTIEDNKITDSKLISNYINTYFTNIGYDLATKIPVCDNSPLSYLTNSYPDFTPSNTTIEEITAIIKSLKDCSPGCDKNL